MRALSMHSRGALMHTCHARMPCAIQSRDIPTHLADVGHASTI